MARKSKAYRDLSADEVEALARRQREKGRSQSYSDFLPRGRLSWFEIGQQFEASPRKFRKGFRKTWGAPKTKKGRSEFRAGILWWRRNE